jgi:hypothetical protein
MGLSSKTGFLAGERSEFTDSDFIFGFGFLLATRHKKRHGAKGQIFCPVSHRNYRELLEIRFIDSAMKVKTG